MLAIFKAMLDSNSVDPKGKEQVTKANNYLAKRLVSVAVVLNKSTPKVAALYNIIPYSKVSGRQWLSITLLFNVTCCRRVLGFHPHLSCPGEALGFGVASFKACGCGRGLCPKQVVQHGPSM